MNSYTALKVPRMDTYRGCVCVGGTITKAEFSQATSNPAKSTSEFNVIED